MNIIRGTTPNIRFTFSEVNPTNFVKAYLSIPEAQIRKDIDEATIGTNYVEWRLSQAETLSFGDNVSAMFNGLTSDGIRIASEKTLFVVEKNYIEEVI